MSTEGGEAGREIGTLGATAIVAGAMLGVGIFLTPHLVAQSVSSPGLFLLLWALGGVLAVAGAVTYGELGAMMPDAGGDYVYLGRAFGPTLSFAAGVVLFVGVFGGSIASMSAALSQYQLSLLFGRVGVDLATPWIPLAANVSLSGVDVVAIALVLGLTVLNVLGVRLSSHTQTFLTLVPVVVLSAFAVFALVTAPHATAVPPSAPSGGPAAIGEGLLNIYFAYAGWNAVAYVGGEVANPGRTIPRALLLGTGLVTGLYLLLCASWIAVLGMGGIAQAFESGTAAARALFGPHAEWMVALIIAIALVGSVNATVLGGARIGYAMGRDGALPASLGELSARARVPARALWAQALLSIALVVTGTFEELVQLTSVAMFLLGSLTVLALFTLRRREPNAERPYRASLYPLLPGLYLLTAIAVVGLEVRNYVAGDAQSGLPLLGIGVFAGVWLLRRAFPGRGAA